MVQLRNIFSRRHGHIWRLEQWMSHVAERRPNCDNELIRQATILAKIAGEHTAAANGESCFHMGLTQADLLIELEMDREVISAALLYSCLNQDAITLEDIAEEISPSVANLLSSTIKMEAVHELYSAVKANESSSKVDNIRKMLLAIAEDLRVVFIKLAEQVSLLTHPGLLKEDFKTKIAHEALAIYAPLANRLGIYQLKWLLEDMALAVLESDTYKYISKSLNEKRIDRENYVHFMIEYLQKLTKKSKIKKTEISGRAKHIYGIYKKMQKKHIGFEEVYDTYALRILVSTIEDCYSILSVIHEEWKPIQEEFDDYISNPKPNGYKSIHTAIIGPEDKAVEIQIRTFQMHREAEMGVAAHWAYKESHKPEDDYQNKIDWLRQIMAWQKEVTESESVHSELYSQMFDDQVYVFTPKGDIHDLPQESTPLDLAYRLHTDLGHKCKGAKVNGKLVPLNTSLKTGDRVEIQTSESGQPSRDWLNPEDGYLATARARTKVYHWFRKQDENRNIEEGEAILGKLLKKEGLENTDISNAIKSLQFSDKNQLHAAIGRGDATAQSVIRELKSQAQNAEDLPLIKKAPAKSDKSSDIEAGGMTQLLSSVANCCKPLPGEEILGYVTQGKGISIHKESCPNLIHMRELRPQRVIQVDWTQKVSRDYPVDILIEGTESSTLIHEVNSILNQGRYAIHDFVWSSDSSENKTKIKLTVSIANTEALNTLINKLQNASGVIKVLR